MMEEQKTNPETKNTAPASPQNSTGGTASSQTSTCKEVTGKTTESKQPLTEQGLPTGTTTEKNIVNDETETINQSQSAQPQQPQQPQQTYQLPPGYAVDPATGQMFFIGTQQPVQQPQQAYQLPPGYAVDPATGQTFFIGHNVQQPVQPTYVQPGVIYTKPPSPPPEQLAEQQAAAQQRYGQVINTVENFFEGEATVADVVKTLYTNTSQDDQLWRGVIVGAAAAVLLTSEPVRKVMGKTLGDVFPGLKTEK